MCILLYLKWITNKDYCIAQGTLPNVMWQPGWKRSLGGEWIHVYVWLSPFAVYLKLSQHCYSAILQYKIKNLKEKKRYIDKKKKIEIGGEKQKSSNKRREIRVPENPATDVGCDSTKVGLTELP